MMSLQALIFVVDSTDRERMGEAAEELHRLIASETQQDLVPFESKERSLEWVCGCLASAPKPSRPQTPEPNA